MMQFVTVVVAVIALLQAGSPSVNAVLKRYVDGIGGEDALKNIRTRITDGEFDNGRGLKTRFINYEQAPDKRTVLIGTSAIESDEGSGRGFDGAVGWDKNFIGTGLRRLEGPELLAARHEADISRPLHVFDPCKETTLEPAGQADVVACTSSDGTRMRFHFDKESGLLTKQETLGSRGTTVVSFEDYQRVDGVRLPMRTRITLPAGGLVSYVSKTVRHNAAIDESVFRLPRH
jgi:hypothetical protein